MIVRSNAIVPGYIDTPMIAGEFVCFYGDTWWQSIEQRTNHTYIIGFSENESTKLMENIPLGRFGNPHEIADAAVFLAQNEYANNCVLNLDGGLSAV